MASYVFFAETEVVRSTTYQYTSASSSLANVPTYLGGVGKNSIIETKRR